jgi:hypothetical protein
MSNDLPVGLGKPDDDASLSSDERALERASITLRNLSRERILELAELAKEELPSSELIQAVKDGLQCADPAIKIRAMEIASKVFRWGVSDWTGVESDAIMDSKTVRNQVDDLKLYLPQALRGGSNE